MMLSKIGCLSILQGYRDRWRDVCGGIGNGWSSGPGTENEEEVRGGKESGIKDCYTKYCWFLKKSFAYWSNNFSIGIIVFRWPHHNDFVLEIRSGRTRQISPWSFLIFPPFLHYRHTLSLVLTVITTVISVLCGLASYCRHKDFSIAHVFKRRPLTLHAESCSFLSLNLVLVPSALEHTEDDLGGHYLTDDLLFYRPDALYISPFFIAVLNCLRQTD